MFCLVVYDIPDDAARTKVADVCLDYGLERIQFSAFMGDLSPNHQGELFLKIRRQVGGKPANVQLFPICERDLRQRRVLANGPRASKSPSGSGRTPPGTTRVLASGSRVSKSPSVVAAAAATAESRARTAADTAASAGRPPRARTGAGPSAPHLSATERAAESAVRRPEPPAGATRRQRVRRRPRDSAKGTGRLSRRDPEFAGREA